MNNWRMFRVTDRKNKSVMIAQEQFDRIYTIESIKPCRPAILNATDGEKLITSIVNQNMFVDEFLHLRTEDKIYYFQTCDDKGDWC